MSQTGEGTTLYTTGEVAKLCSVSVRTVQYYDGRGILIPSQLSEGGRRLYTEEDVKRMRVICFLRDAGFSINNIGDIFAEEHPERILSILLDQQEKDLREELDELQRKLGVVAAIRREIKDLEHISVESIGDIAYMMKQKKALKRMRLTMILTGLPVSALQITAVILGITHGAWWLLGLWAAVAIPWGILVSLYYFRHAAYICPACHALFKPRMKEAFWAYHTPRMRRLTCPSCKKKSLCVEVYDAGAVK
jgi:DNA-binding transcriptional MerR regulator